MLDLPVLGVDTAYIVARIARSKAPLKLVLKTKDDPYFLPQWIQHHRLIVGDGNLIILDNGSTDPGVVSIYERERNDILIARLDGLHYDLNYPGGRFAPLYSALRASSQFFMFIDTDEFIGHYDGQRISFDERILEPLTTLSENCGFIPSTWLQCVTGFRDRFLCGADETTLRYGLKWGKPMLNARCTGLPELVNHNTHLKGYLRPSALAGYFLLHLSRLSPKQRIRANFNKLVARGIIGQGDTVEDLWNKDFSTMPAIIRMFVDEIRELSLLPDDCGNETAPLSRGMMKISESGELVFASGLEAMTFNSYFKGFSLACTDVLEGPPNSPAKVFRIE